MNPLDNLKDAVIAEVASDVLRIRADIEEILPMVDQLKAALPGHFDALRAGLIETLEEIDNGIKEAGGERIEFVKGQLAAFIQQAIEKSFKDNSDRIDEAIRKFEQQNNAAVSSLSSQYEEVSKNLQRLKKESENNKIPKWLKITIPLAFIIAIGATSLLSWQLSSYKEAVYMNAFMSQLGAEKTGSQ
jgi:molecular chaperone GrpE (heat shock protein)